MRIIDFETRPIRPGYLAPKPVCLATRLGETSVTLSDSIPSELWRKWLEGPIAGWNIAFDMACLIQDRPELTADVFRAYREDRIYDAMLAEQLIDIATGHYGLIRKSPGYSLDAQGERWGLGGKTHDEWKLRYEELESVPFDLWPQGAKIYPARDVELTEALIARQSRFDYYLSDVFRQSRASFSLYLVSAWGMAVDPDWTSQLKTHKEQKIDAMQKALVQEGLVRADGSRNVKAVGARVKRAYEALGKPFPATPTPDKKTGELKPKTDGLTCLQSKDPVLKMYGELGDEMTFVSNFIPTLLTVGRIHPRYYIAESGRALASSPNSQNFPRKGGVREAFRPSLGVYLQADYNQLELHTLAQVCLDILGRSSLAEILRSKEPDAHRHVAAELLHTTYAAVKEHPQYDNARQSGKVANFGYPGGLGHKRFCDFALSSYGVIVTEADSRTLKSAWLSKLPEMQDYFTFVANCTERSESIMQVRSNRIRGGVGYTDGCNTLFQGLGADCAKDALFDVCEKCFAVPGNPLFGSRPMNFIHDEIVIDAPEEGSHEAATELAATMEEAGRRWMPALEIKAPPVVARRWSKHMQAVTDESGRLIPWDVTWSELLRIEDK